MTRDVGEVYLFCAVCMFLVITTLLMMIAIDQKAQCLYLASLAFSFIRGSAVYSLIIT